ncbi:DeoR family transcriptional regulator, partial [Vibrio parahaemolyticus]|nr:DeoR family transcriptional regulator [Vibrio parahaemolyticus]
MIPAERQRTILSLLSHQEVLSISDLTDHLGVSHMTIRRDIVKLESSGKVVSV